VTDDSTADPLARLITAPATTRFWQFLEGASTPWLGLSVMRHRPYLWKYAIVPIVLNIAIMFAALLAMVAMASGSVALLYWLLGDWQGNWWYAALALQILAAIVTVIICIATAVLTWRLLSGVLCGYFYGRLAMRVETEFGMNRDELREISLADELRDTAAGLFWLLISLVLALIVSLIPFIGPPIGFLYSTYFQTLSCGRDTLAYPLQLRAMRRAERLAYSRRHTPHTLGLGSVVLVMQFVPILGAVLMVTAAAGAVVLHRRLKLAQPEVDSTAGATAAATSN
jgi:uncharacterized protein involved in cysteine biosynthesis